MDNSERNQKSSKPCLRIVTLGGFQLFRRVGEQDEWEEFVERELSERGPSRVFLKVLASSGPRMSSHRRSLAQKWQEWESHEVSRDAMINALWPEDEQVPADPQRAVAVAKSVLNKALRTVAGGDVVLLTEGSDSLGYRLNMSLVTLDADEFELFVHQGSLAEGQGEKKRACALWEQANALVQGEFLPHDQYNDWSKTRRDRLLAKYRLVLHRLARCYQDAGQITEAVEKLHPHVVADPTNLDALCVLLPLLAEQGRYKEALELLEAGKQAMRQEEIPLPPVLAELASSLRRRQEAAWFQIVQTLSSEEDAERVPRASSLLLPSSPERTHDTWFTLKQQLLQTVVSQWNGRAMYCDELQIIVDQELRMFDRVKSLYHQDAYVLSRRRVLAALASFPLALLVPSPRKRKPAVYPEEFLPECAAGITSCWYLLNDGDGLATIEHTLPVYLPKLIAWARQPSRYQCIAAALAAQGSLLMDLVAYHRFRFQDSLVYANQAVGLAQLSGDLNLLAYALLLSGGAYNLNEQPQMMLQKHLEAALTLGDVLPPLQSYVLAELAYAYAQNGMVSDALHTIGEARDRFPGHFGEVPGYLSADYDLSQLILFEGLTHITLGVLDSDQARKHYERAKKALAQVDHLPPDQLIPERLRVEITNYQAQAAIGVGNLDEAEQYLLAGIQGAATLGSEKRRQEALTNWQTARIRWPHEKKLLALTDALLP